jgi:SH3 domain protein
MKLAAALGLFLVVLGLCAAPDLAAKGMYVSDRMQITVRTGPTTENRVIEMISSGDQVTVLEETNDGWARVRTASGKEGWVLRRFLIDEIPAVVRLHEFADGQGKNLAQRLEEAKREGGEAKRLQALAETRAREAEAALQKLQSECAEVVKLREEYGRLQEEYQQQTQEIEELSTEIESMRFSTNLKWFLAGGGVLFLGWLIGLAFGRRKKRWTSGMY